MFRWCCRLFVNRFFAVPMTAVFDTEAKTQTGDD
jgi:hypothetical protein